MEKASLPDLGISITSNQQDGFLYVFVLDCDSELEKKYFLN